VTHFHRALRKYGPDAFEFQILQEFESVEDAKRAEINAIAHLSPEYNKTLGGDGVWGYKHTPEAIERNRQAHIGFKHTEETCERIAAGQRGRTRSVETRARMSKAKTGCSRPDVKGKPRSAEVRAKIRAGHLRRLANKLTSPPPPQENE
jgi:hypothetical protein